MNKLLVASILTLAIVLGCKTTPETTPAPPVETLKPAVGLRFNIQEWNIKYDVTNKAETNEGRCYKVLLISQLPTPERNIWYKAGLRIGDYIVMVESRPGFMAPLQCKNLDSTIQLWFPGKARENIYEEDGFWIERLRFNIAGGFSLETLIVRYE
jgi:hypothetical protein